MKVTALAGGVGGAKLLVGLYAGVGADLTAIVNTGDDADIYGVHVSPDVDIVTYWLAGIADRARGWGIKDDAFTVVAALGKLGHETWFSLGDRDFATCLYRTDRLKAGAALSEITAEITRSLGVDASVLPMTDDHVATRIVTDDGRTLEFQEYFVKERCAPEVREVRFAGISDAQPAPGVIQSIERADRVVVCPSNPLLSISPILALPGVRDALRAHPNVIAVSPIIQGAALKGPADRILESTGHRSSASSVALMYEDFIDTFVLDSSDIEEAGKVEAAGIQTLVTDTVMTDLDASARLAQAVLS
ncbi:MAG: 2-phospho-L-lactate transferase [Actinomycetota bacterium]|jgi:LPPG:FO 2-phospho-L-lactate transferase|nr:2-phospho-L-lactate transferase [Actinomycetota bacterium]